MARTTAKAVKDVLLAGRDYDTERNPTLLPYIDAASSIMDDVAACYVRKGLTLSDAKAEIVERWLSAHCYQASDQGYTSRSTEGASGNFMGQTAMYLEGTKYGQMALSLETQGCLAAVASGKQNARARAYWLGKANRTEAVDYVDRD